MSAKTVKAADKKNAPVMMIVGIVVLVAVLIVGKMFLGGAKAADKKPVEEIGITLPLDEFMVNLAGGGEHYLRANIALGMKKGITEEQAKEHVSAIRDTILTVLTEQTLKDLSSSKTREAMKGTLKTHLNKELGDELVVKVYFTSFATQ